jgi:hypothetical protein
MGAVTTPVVESHDCRECGEELRFDPWMLKWVDRHHAWQVGKLRTAPAFPHVHSPIEN